ncbi:glycosyltransferase family 4 protein [Pseudochelatococcus lubricantis]|uniref:glycosyltransferase family 4 protein n=1 Tax=Pseudochelatococcus lubricantis TaxID=1538102 RepID=UPI0035EEA300
MTAAGGGRAVAYYAPMKAPDHPVASGDRRMARLLFAALSHAGFRPRLESRLRAYEPTGADGAQDALAEAAEAEAARLLTLYAREPGARPALWFTYHSYYKAVDRVGPAVARALSIPYCIAEASHAPRRAAGAFARAHAANEAALRAADVLFVMTAQDRAMLERLHAGGQRLVDLPPFIDAVPGRREPRPPRPVAELLTVAMMRRGDKLESFRLLARALARVAKPWRLTVAGDGEARAEVEALFAGLAGEVVFLGLVDDAAALAALYAGADLLVWPAVNEAYGMIFLEAAAQGCPSLAGAWGGVASVVIDGETGVLTPPGDVEAFAQALAALIENPARRAVLGGGALALVARSRTLDHAADTLRAALSPLPGMNADRSAFIPDKESRSFFRLPEIGKSSGREGV